MLAHCTLSALLGLCIFFFFAATPVQGQRQGQAGHEGKGNRATAPELAQYIRMAFEQYQLQAPVTRSCLLLQMYHQSQSILVLVIDITFKLLLVLLIRMLLSASFQTKLSLRRTRNTTLWLTVAISLLVSLLQLLNVHVSAQTAVTSTYGPIYG